MFNLPNCWFASYLMMKKKNKAFESLESSSPIITRAVSSGLQGKWTENYTFPAYQRLLLEILGRFPQEISRKIISVFQSYSGLPPACLDQFSIDSLINERLKDYDQLEGEYPALVIGAGVGGAAAYLSISLNAPFLPQSFVISLRKGSYYGNAKEYLNRSIKPALEIAKNDPRIMTIQHFDPVHDGWLTKFVNHLRFKLIDLPDLYKKFIRSRLKKGGSIVFLNSDARWLRYRLGERSVFQIGGWGDISAEEFLTGSERLESFAKKNHLRESHWNLNNLNFPLENGPESEWGCENGLSEKIENFCDEEGYKFVLINLQHPNDFSRLALLASSLMIEKDGNVPAGSQIECFSQFDCTSAFRSSLLPLWLVFNTIDSAKYLQSMMKFLPAGKPVFFSPLSTFSITPDIAEWDMWEEILGKNFINFGARKSHYPSDPWALLHWNEPLRNWVNNNQQPVLSRLSADELFSLYKTMYNNC